MEETRTGGTKEFIFSFIWLVILLMIGRMVTNALQNYKIIGVAVTIVMFCVLGFFVMTRYCAVYTYTLKNDRLRINRRIGHRDKEVETGVSSVKSISKQRPNCKVKNTYNMRTTVFSSKDVWYLVYDRNGETNLLVFEPSRKMADKIKSRSKQIKN